MKIAKKTGVGAHRGKTLVIRISVYRLVLPVSEDFGMFEERNPRETFFNGNFQNK